MEKKVRIIKISDDKFSKMGMGHPGNINEGYTKTGILMKNPIVGEAVVLFANVSTFSSLLSSVIFHTSIVTEIIDKNIFKTLNSTYKIEEL